MHCELAMDYLASLDLAIPNMKIHQDRIPKESLVDHMCLPVFSVPSEAAHPSGGHHHLGQALCSSGREAQFAADQGW